jgi:hypothetical protein
VFFFLLLAFSLRMLVGRQIMVADRHLPMCLTLVLLCLLALLADALNIRRGFQTSKGVYLS